MDPITHGLAGAVIRNLGFRRPAALFTLVVFSVAPDLDYLTKFIGDDYFLHYHRGLTHGLPALAAVAFTVYFLKGGKKGGAYYSFLAFCAYGVHILFDLTNQYGVRLFAPLDNRVYSLDLTFIVDPYVSVGLLLSVLIANRVGAGPRKVALATMLLVVSYMGVRQYYHDRTVEFLRAAKKDYRVSSIYPMPNDFLRWWFVARDGVGIKVGFADLFTKTVYVHGTYGPVPDGPELEKAGRTRLVRNFLAVNSNPHADIKKTGSETVVTWRDLSYAYAPGEHFLARVVMDDKGRVLSSDFRL